MSDQLRCLILGGGGFIGSHIVDALLVRNHSVRVFERDDAETKNIAYALPKIELVRGNFFCADDLVRAMTGIDVVVHLVSTTIPGSSNENMAYDVETNVIGNIKMLDIARKAGVRKIIFASSGGTVYGLPQFLPVTEAHPVAPICSHGIAKLAAEMYLHLHYHLYGLDYTVLRFANPYGARQNPLSGQGAIAAFLWRTLNDEPISIWGDGTVARDFFHVSDLAAAVLTVVENDTPSKIYNIGSGVPHTLNEVLSLIQDITGKKPSIQYFPARKLDVPVTYLDISRAQKELLWRPQISMREGLSRTWEYLQNAKAS
jgi:UDP-glucose 4-epimerase